MTALGSTMLQHLMYTYCDGSHKDPTALLLPFLVLVDLVVVQAVCGMAVLAFPRMFGGQQQ